MLANGKRFGGQDATVPDDAVQPGDTVTAVIGRYRAAWAQADAIALATSLDELWLAGLMGWPTYRS